MAAINRIFFESKKCLQDVIAANNVIVLVTGFSNGSQQLAIIVPVACRVNKMFTLGVNRWTLPRRD